MEQESQNFFIYLPNEIIISIFSFLDLDSLRRSFSACRLFNEISSSNSLWKRICKNICHYYTDNELIKFQESLGKQYKEWKKICKLLVEDRIDFLSQEQKFAIFIDEFEYEDYHFPIGDSLIEVSHNTQSRMIGLSTTTWGSAALNGILIGEYLAFNRLYHESKWISNGLVKINYSDPNASMMGTFRSTYQNFSGSMVCSNASVTANTLNNMLKEQISNRKKGGYVKVDKDKVCGFWTISTDIPVMGKIDLQILSDEVNCGFSGQAVFNDDQVKKQVLIGCPPVGKLFCLTSFLPSKRDSSTLFLCKYKSKSKRLEGHLMHWDNNYTTPIYKFVATKK